MRQVRINENNYYICEECNKNFKNKIALVTHITMSHKNITSEEYFKKWLFEDSDDICKVQKCNCKTKFIGTTRGYRAGCCVTHTNIIRQQQIECYFENNYGVKNPGQLEEVKQKIIKTNLNHFGVTCNFKHIDTIKKIKQTKKQHREDDPEYLNKVDKKGKHTRKEKYNDENFNNREKAKQTCLERFGAENAFQSEECKEKMKQTCLERFGVENPTQCFIIRNKINNTCEKKFGGKSPTCSYEVIKKIKVTISSDEYKTKMIEKGLWKSDVEKNDYQIYSDLVWKVTYEQVRLFGLKYLKNFENKKENKNIKIQKFFWSIDHKYSIKQGYINNVNPIIVGSIVNLEIMRLHENSSKHSKCSMNLNDLEEKFIKFNKINKLC